MATACTREKLVALHGQVLNLHGETLLMMHWSMLAYTGLVKIMKKYHKRTGKLLHAPDLSDLLSHPFCCTEVRCCTISAGHAASLPGVSKLAEHVALA